MSTIAKKNNGTVDLTEGPLFKKIIAFTVPIILTGLLQLLFNAADIIVVGRSDSNTAIAAVSACNALINLIVNLLIGLSVGAGVCAAKCFGSRDEKGMHRLVHTAMPTAIIGGVIFGLIGIFFGKIFLQWMATPDNVIAQSTLYVQIYFVGVPFTIIYNFGAAILRSVGDTKRPLYFLVISGVVNVGLNLIFVLVFGMDVDGVAWATAISQMLACVLVIVHLMRAEESHRFEPKKMKFYGDKFKEILLVGLPAGIQGSLFSISNVLIQSSINGFGDVTMSGNGSAANIEGFVYIAMNSFHQTALAFTGQHVGAGKQERIKKIALVCLACVTVLGLVLGIGAYLLGNPLLSIYLPEADDAAAIAFGLKRLSIVSATYFLCGIMDVFSGLLRGMGRSVSSMIITLLCVCGLRIVWVFTFFKQFGTLESLYYSYPVSWIVCVLAQMLLFIFAFKKLVKRKKEQPTKLVAEE